MYQLILGAYPAGSFETYDEAREEWAEKSVRPRLPLCAARALPGR